MPRINRLLIVNQKNADVQRDRRGSASCSRASCTFCCANERDGVFLIPLCVCLDCGGTHVNCCVLGPDDAQSLQQKT